MIIMLHVGIEKTKIRFYLVTNQSSVCTFVVVPVAGSVGNAIATTSTENSIDTPAHDPSCCATTITSN